MTTAVGLEHFTDEAQLTEWTVNLAHPSTTNCIARDLSFLPDSTRMPHSIPDSALGKRSSPYSPEPQPLHVPLNLDIQLVGSQYQQYQAAMQDCFNSGKLGPLPYSPAADHTTSSPKKTYQSGSQQLFLPHDRPSLPARHFKAFPQDDHCTLNRELHPIQDQHDTCVRRASHGQAWLVALEQSSTAIDSSAQSRSSHFGTWLHTEGFEGLPVSPDPQSTAQARGRMLPTNNSHPSCPSSTPLYKSTLQQNLSPKLIKPFGKKRVKALNAYNPLGLTCYHQSTSVFVPYEHLHPQMYQCDNLRCTEATHNGVTGWRYTVAEDSKCPGLNGTSCGGNNSQLLHQWEIDKDHGPWITGIQAACDKCRPDTFYPMPICS